MEVRVKPALHEHARSAERNRFVNLLVDFINRADVSFRMSRTAIEGAESADDVADVCVIDVAVNDVSDDARRVKAFANLVRRETDAHETIGLKQGRAVFLSHALASEDSIKNGLNVSSCHKPLSRRS